MAPHDSAVDGSKLASLKMDMKNVEDPDARITTDYGVKQINTGMSRIMCCKLRHPS